MNSATQQPAYPAIANEDQPESHFGDLRKGAYLKRRAAYQLQASSPAGSQAGSLTPRTRTPGQES
ncbi:MAG: hypothetical protein KDI82_07125 [Gammaproteobacteria bacterium]|nr:hypothetical protein [Gammaproteobacteria bacterium]